MIRRFLECLVALIMLVLASPLLLVIAIAIVVVSPGNPFYMATRVGKNGKPFRMFKFRTMKPDASKLGPVITSKRDPRIILIGHFLRRTKLDEFPQFINVLLGDMALVGPRPEVPEIVALYGPAQAEVLCVKPGITGKVQLEGEESDSIPEAERAKEYYVKHIMERKLRSDLAYIHSRSLLGDARIVAATALYLLRSLLRH
jgi:lipopolysaccharide/colanic/teichoic acid biosynthesis glycosyltransferase